MLMMAEEIGIKLYGDLMSPPCRTVALFLRMNGIQYTDMQAVAFRKGNELIKEHKKVNLVHVTPAIDDHGFIVTESDAILRYMCYQYELSDHWYPSSPCQRARIDEFLSWCGTSLHPATTSIYNHQVVEPKIKNIPVDLEHLRHFERQLDRSLDRMEDVFLFDTPYIASNDLTIADLTAVCELIQSKAAAHDIVVGRPRLAAWFDRVSQRLEPELDAVNSKLRCTISRESYGLLYQCESFDM